MEDNNPYQAPAAAVVERTESGDLAGRGTRFAAALIDTLIMMALVLPAMYLGGYFTLIASGQQPGIGTLLLWTLFGFVVFLLVQGYPLVQWGQTWGKRLLKIRIVDLQGNKPSLGTLLGKRYLPVQVAAAIPLIGNVLVLVDVLFIFRADHRCVHDLIAGTRVVKA